jgi:hypothetical protein
MRRTPSSVVAWIALALASHWVIAADLDPLGRNAVDRFLEQHNGAAQAEVTTLQAGAMVDFDRNGTPEIALVWTTLGPTYWRNTLSVLTLRDGSYREVARVGLEGEARLSSVNQDGTIVIESKVYAVNDPRCCPSVAQHRRYRYANGTLMPVRG